MIKAPVTVVFRTLLVGISLVATALLPVAAGAALGVQSDQRVPGVFPVIVEDTTTNSLGVFTGMLPIRVENNRYTTVWLVMSPQGYISPIHPGGDVAAVGPVFYQSKDCSGAEYIRATSQEPVFAGLPGTVFSTILMDGLVYIPSGSTQLSLQMNSRSDSVGKRDMPECVTGLLDGYFYRLEKNSIARTGHTAMTYPGPLMLVPAHVQIERRAQARRDAAAENAADSAADLYVDLPECSPGCLPGDVGNSDCDIACYTAECSYDSGDCDELPASELEELLRSICSPGCFAGEINDGFCDAQCNVEPCGFDGDDCNDER